MTATPSFAAFSTSTRPKPRRLGAAMATTAIAADAAVAMDDATFADAGFRIHDDGTEVLQMQVFSEASSADDESQSRSQSILPATIPETEQFVRRGEGVLFFFAKEAQIPLDVVHLRTDPPFHKYFLECHGLMRMRTLSVGSLSTGMLFGAAGVPSGKATPDRTRQPAPVSGKTPGKAKMNLRRAVRLRQSVVRNHGEAGFRAWRR